MECKDKKVELLVPAGSKEAFLSAVVSGADAIYFGCTKFNARKRASNISLQDLKSLIPVAHAHNIRCYMTVNIVVFDEELEEVLVLIQEAKKIGVDAVIVQDIGLMFLIAQKIPTMPIHVSTQATTHNSAQCDFLIHLFDGKKSITQVNLSRELSLNDIAFLGKYLNKHDIKTEVFIHGAYCISYSGQCYMSGELYGERGNRGQCVQPCRRSYIVKNGGLQDCVPFNLKDNCAFSFIDELIDAGVRSLKIEGRIKDEAYVWATTKAYRNKIDESINDTKDLLEGSFNRGFSDDYLKGLASKSMFAANAFPKDKSFFDVGTVISYTADTKKIIIKAFKYDNPLKQIRVGSSLFIYTKEDVFVCSAEIVTVVSQPGNKTLSATYILKITSKPDDKNILKIKKGQKVLSKPIFIAPCDLKTKIDDCLKDGLKKKEEYSLAVFVSAKKNKALQVVFRVLGLKNTEISLLSESLLFEAQKKPLSEAILKEKLCSFGGTSFSLGSFSFESDGTDLFIPLKELKKIRREGVEFLSLKIPKTSKAVYESISLDEKEILKPQKKEDKYAFIFDTKEEALAHKGNDIIVYEMPLFWGENVECFLIENPHIVPLFSSILFEEDLKRAKALLEVLAKNSQGSKRIYSENTGLAFVAKELGFSVILGAFCNTTNAYTFNTYEKALNCSAIIPSCEISLEALKNIRFSDSHCELWYPLNYNQILMQSRQCLVKNIPDENGLCCLKENCDRECILHCSRRVFFEDSQKKSLMALKRPGFYSALYREDILSHENIKASLRDFVDVWIIDKRNMKNL